jgi:hypothetical protein
MSGVYIELNVIGKIRGVVGKSECWLVDYMLGRDNMPRLLNFGQGLTGEILTIVHPDLLSQNIRILSSAEIKILPMGRIYINSINRLQLKNEWVLYQKMVDLGQIDPYSNTGVTGASGGKNV